MIFQNLHPQSKIWLYISPDKIESFTQNNISLLFKDFVEDWKSHGQAVNGQLKFLNDNLLAVGADYFPDGMCGRAVDAQVRFINQINERFNLDLLNNSEKNYLFKYHLNVYSKISKYLNQKEKKWLTSFI